MFSPWNWAEITCQPSWLNTSVILILRLVHAAALLAAIQSYEFPNINSSSKQLPQRHQGLPYTSNCSRSDKNLICSSPPGVFISNVNRFPRKKFPKSRIQELKWYLRKLQSKLITSSPSHLGHNVTCGRWSNLMRRRHFPIINMTRRLKTYKKIWRFKTDSTNIQNLISGIYCPRHSVNEVWACVKYVPKQFIRKHFEHELHQRFGHV